MTRERDIRKALKKRVEEYGGEVRAVSWIGRKHAPDVLCLFTTEHWGGDIPRYHCFVETKAPGGKLNAGQAREHERMRAARCTVLAITTIEELDTWLPPSN